MGRYNFYPAYVSVAEKKENAQAAIKKMQKKGIKLNPVSVEGRNITSTFWGKSWCKHIETFKDAEYRLARGRSCLRADTVLDLKIGPGTIDALVLGSSKYEISIKIKPLAPEKWKSIVSSCSGQIDSVVALLQGKLSKPIMEKMTDVNLGLFPNDKEISISCSCPDYVVMCKHAAAAFYGVGVRLDSSPESLFLLRSVDHLELLETNVLDSLIDQDGTLDGDLSELFGIDLVAAKK